VSLGPAEIIVVLVIALLVFGPTRLPEVGRQVGRTMREFRKFQQTMRRDIDEVFGHDTHDVSHAAEPPPSLPPKADDPNATDEPPTATDDPAPPSDAPPDSTADTDRGDSRTAGNGDGN
jgi:sec-independent protein translocase protein TatA